MSIGDWLQVLGSMVLLGYLVYALVRPERF